MASPNQAMELTAMRFLPRWPFDPWCCHVVPGRWEGGSSSPIVSNFARRSVHDRGRNCNLLLVADVMTVAP